MFLPTTDDNKVMLTIPLDVYKDFRDWLEYHKQDIELGVNDFDELQGVYRAVFKAPESPEDKR